MIAIIAILAAILFPVFAQARAKARQASCLSNMKQIALGVVQYTQDYDETMPIAHNCLPTSGTPKVNFFCQLGNERFDWNRAVLPYIKAPLSRGESVFRCPDIEQDFYNNWSPNPVNGNDDWAQQFTSYGFNKDYLQPNRLCGTSDLLDGAATVWGQPASQADIEAPANTVMLVDTKPAVILDSGAFYPSNLAFSPAAYGGNAGICPLDGWGVDSAFESGPGGIGGETGTKKTGTGSFSPRHSDGGNAAFCDGHVKWYRAGGLAAGTNWSADKGVEQVQITNLSQYLWSLKKTNSDI